ncbi:MAG: DUF2235 domain-containing protein [Leptolyngbya sp. LCM1.Bin17]|nr:MAG: DUF2235 domain-containing protein [Leptolyngbya sp. LCM1.Bin17]
MQRLVVCCDGTWQEANQPYPTNVKRIFQTIKTTETAQPQHLYYRQGIGSGGDVWNRLMGGAFGWGIDDNIQEAYQFLCHNYALGDEIYLFGYSRGAYTVRSLGGLMRIAGGVMAKQDADKIPALYDIYRSEGHYSDANQLSEDELNRRELARKEAAVQALGATIQPATITVLCCWDTVGSLGIPNTIPFISRQINQKYKFHDCQLSHIIQRALHGVAIDEPRHAFDITPMEQSQANIDAGQVLHQIWFPGNHGAVGGGVQALQPLSDGALLWAIDMIRHTFQLGLEFDPNLVESAPAHPNRSQHFEIRPDPKAEVPEQPVPWVFRLTGLKPRTIKDDDELHRSVFERWQALPTYRPKNMPPALVAKLNLAQTV